MKIKLYIILLIIVLYSSKKNHIKKETIEKKEEKEKEKDQKEKSKNTKTVKLKKYIKVIKDTPEAIKPEDIKIKVNSGEEQTEQKTTPNFLGLAILWAHFQAYRQGLLREDNGAPWEHYKEEGNNNGRNLWREFLAVIIDENWSQWIQDLEEVKFRTIRAFSEL